nr:hypothetical protein [Tanacetum cinerariifolium]
KAGCYRCQLDEQWFVLTKETLREALQITPVNNNQAFVAPPSIDGLINFVNQLGYRKEKEGHSDCDSKHLVYQADHPKAKKSKHGWVGKKHSLKNVEASKTEEVPNVEPQVADEDADYQKVLEESIKDAYALPRGPLL